MISEEVKVAIRQLEDDDGRVEPRDVVDAARNPGSPLHGHFEWDDAAAADTHRLQTARRLIGSVRMIVTRTHIPITAVRYVKNPVSDTGYINLNRIRDNEKSAREVMMEELGKVRRAARRCRSVAVYVNAVTEVEALLRASEEILKALECPLDTPETV